jgi:TonB family protein
MATPADTTNSTASKRMRGASPDDLAVVAQRAQAFTNASGVAIALSEGNANEIVCRARSGASAPDVGAALRVEGTFTGLCIQTGKELRCDDCETDTRVDMNAIRALGIRSMVVTPIREESRVVGVLAAFAPTPHAFTITHVAVLKTMADQIAVLLQKERRARDENPQPEIPRPAAPAIVAKPMVTQMPVAPPPVVIKSSPSAAPAFAAPAFAKVEPIRSTPLEVVPLAVPPKVEKRAADVAPRANFGTFDSVADEEKKSGSKFMVVGVVAVLIVAAAATFTFLKMQKHGAAAPQSAQEAGNAQPSSSQPASGQGSSAQVPTAQASTSAPVNNAQPASSAGNGGTAASTVIVAANSAATSSKPSGKVAVDKSFSDRSDKPSPAEKPATVATLNSGQSRIAQQDSSAGSEVAPSFTVVSGNTGAPLTNLVRPSATSTPTAAAMEQSQLEPLQLIKTGTPIYPAIAKARSITGTVVVQGTVDKNGKVTNLQFISGQPIFKDAAFEAARQYQFKPAKLNGHPIEQITQIKLIFH